jgi:hypothetical protein
VTLPAGSGPGDIVLNSNNTKLAGVRVTTSLIDSFTLDHNGRPHAAPGSPFVAQGLGPSPIGTSPFADFQTAPCWWASAPTAATCTRSTPARPSSSYVIAWDGTLTLLSNTPVSSTPGVTGTNIALSPDGRTLYLNMAKINSVGAFAVNGATVTQLPGSPTPAAGTGSTAGITTS